MAKRRTDPTSLNAALALERKGDVAGAEVRYRALLRDEPDRPELLARLGALLRRTGRPADAVPLLGRAIAVSSQRGCRPPGAWLVALAHAKRDSGDPTGALAIFNAMVREAPRVPEPLYFRAGVLQGLGRHDEALRDYEELVKRAPNDARVFSGLGRSLRAVGQLDKATAAFCKAVALDGNDADSALAAATLLGQRGQIERAINLLRQARKQHPADVAIANTLVDALIVGNGLDEAEAVARDLKRRHPRNPSVLIRIAQILVTRGELEAARKLARRALALGPGFVASLKLLSEIDADHRPTSLLSQINEQLEHGRNNDQETVALHFAAGRVKEKLGKGPEALRSYAAANRLLRQRYFHGARAYNQRHIEATVASIIDAFGPGTFDQRAGSRSERPIFIVGMPRSGTTLIEQILASHPDVFGAGELKEIGRITSQLADSGRYPAGLAAEDVEEAADDYMAHIAGIGGEAARVTDKMPGNFMHLGLICRMFPKASIVHCRRDPMDTCLSCFAQNYLADTLAWTTDLVDLGHYYCQYRRLMTHWRAVLPAGRMLEIDYEDTVADLEGEARKLVDFVGLTWNEGCMAFHKSARPVVTASRAQVRNPIYTTSVGRWRRYGDGALPLARALAVCGCGPEAECDGNAR